jgi:hypothetical protein
MKQIISFVLLVLINSYLFSQNDELINKAINDGNCEILYNFIQDTTGKDQKLVTNSNQTLKKYTSIDTSTSKYRSNKMDPKIRNVSKELIDNVFISPEKYLSEVVIKLTTGISDQFSKTKVLHDWICDNIAYDTNMVFVIKRITNQDYISVLKKKKAVCSGYTNLFNQMCKLAEIESIGINGYSKGFGYTGSLGSNTDHDWNAVRINNKWYLIDVTWDAGHVDYKTFIKNYSTDYLFLDSRPFLYSHLPAENKFQFYAPIITKTQFIEEPYIAGVFFKYGLELKTDLPHYSNNINEAFTFDIVLKNSNVNISNKLRTQYQQNVEGASWTIRKNSIVTFVYDIPNGQEYKGHIFARIRDEKRIQEKIDSNFYEQKIIPSLDSLLQNKKITEKEKELFLNSYYKVAENQCYYFLEDQFDSIRNNAVIKIHPLIELSLETYENVIDFILKPESGYNGFKDKYNKRFPDTYAAYNEALNTSLISPINGELIKGTEETFVIESKDFTRFAIVIDNKFNFFEKNTNGAFELILNIPTEINEIQIFGTKNNSNYIGLLKFGVK